MSTDAGEVQRYTVTYSKRVLAALARLGREARDRGDLAAFTAALQDFHQRLRVYPQFGDPLSDLRTQDGQIRIGIVPPLAMRYGVLEELRQVIVGAIPVLLPRAKDE